MKDVIIIGKGPAGVSAALYIVRAGLNVTIIGKDEGALLKADKIENYYGFSEPVQGKDLLENSIQGALRLGVEVLNGEVFDITYNGEGYAIKSTAGEFSTKSVILATGTQRSAPPIPGLKALEGKGIAYCAVCDAFFYKGKDVAVLGSGEYALHEAMELLSTSGSVTLLSNGQDFSPEVQKTLSKSTEGTIFDGKKILTDKRKVSEILGEDKVKGVLFNDGTTAEYAGIFIAVGTAGSTDIARKLGIPLEKNKIVVNEDMSTMAPGFYAAGDCTGGMLQVAKAVYEGALAGTSVVKYVRSK